MSVKVKTVPPGSARACGTDELHQEEGEADDRRGGHDEARRRRRRELRRLGRPGFAGTLAGHGQASSPLRGARQRARQAPRHDGDQQVHEAGQPERAPRAEDLEHEEAAGTPPTPRRRCWRRKAAPGSCAGVASPTAARRPRAAYRHKHRRDREHERRQEQAQRRPHARAQRRRARPGRRASDKVEQEGRERHRHSDRTLQPGVEQEWRGWRSARARSGASRRPAARKDRQDRGRRGRRGAEHETELAHPHGLVDQRAEARGEQQSAHPSNQGRHGAEGTTGAPPRQERRPSGERRRSFARPALLPRTRDEDRERPA